MKKICCKDQLSLVVTHDDFKDADGNLQELHAVKKHFSIQEEGDPDLFFNVPQERQEETMDTHLPDAVDSELRGRIMVDCQIWLLLYLVWSMWMMTISWPQKTFPQ